MTGHSWQPVVKDELVTLELVTVEEIAGTDWCKRCGCLRYRWGGGTEYQAPGCKPQKPEPSCVDGQGELLDSIDLLERAARNGNIAAVQNVVRRRFSALRRRFGK